MIKSSFLKKQIEKAKEKRKTPKFLRRLIFLAVDRALKKHYSETYSMKCLQSSLALGMVLEKFDIRSRAIVGGVCVAQVFDDNKRTPSWNGFWGEDHHVWSYSEFGEIADLTIRYLHLHPTFKAKAPLPMPALWWEDTINWPCIIKYLPQGSVKPILPDEEMRDLVTFKKKVSSELDTVLKTYSVQEIEFHPILHGANSMNELHEKGDPWLRASLVFQDLKFPYPLWVQEREAELMRPYTEET